MLTPFFKGVSVVDFYKFIEERAENQLLTVNSVNLSCSSALLYSSIFSVSYFKITNLKIACNKEILQP